MGSIPGLAADLRGHARRRRREAFAVDLRRRFGVAAPSAARYWEFTVTAPEALSYYYVLVTQADGDRAMSAPIWVEGAAGLLP
jgi:hypothetical protein